MTKKIVTLHINLIWQSKSNPSYETVVNQKMIKKQKKNSVKVWKKNCTKGFHIMKENGSENLALPEKQENPLFLSVITGEKLFWNLYKKDRLTILVVLFYGIFGHVTSEQTRVTWK